RCPRAPAPWTSRFTRGCTRSGKPLPWRPSRCFSSPWWRRWRAGARAMRERGLVVIPTYNEVGNLTPLVEQVLAQDARLEILVLGSRYLGGRVTVVNWPMGRLVLSYCANIYARWITGLRIWDLTGGFKCFRRRVLEAIDLSQVRSNGYAFQIEMSVRAWRKGFTLKEIPIVFVDRTE